MQNGKFTATPEAQRQTDEPGGQTLEDIEKREKLEQPDPKLFESVKRIAENVARVVKGKRQVIDMALTGLLARGHLLIEDVPGVGKTTLARALARSIGGSFRRIQFTSDLMPSDILGVSVFNQKSGEFVFKEGPIFANVVLADEINRTTPRTQSSLLEAMNEGQVSMDNETIELPRPFFVVATQNPQEHFGTYPLPESQMDRFALRIVMGYPDADEEKKLLVDGGDWEPLESLSPVSEPGEIVSLQKAVVQVSVEEILRDYVMNVVAATRSSKRLSLGISTRGAKAWYATAKAHALVQGRGYCLPDDFKYTAVPALAHRVVLSTFQDTLARTRVEAEAVLGDILRKVEVPL